MALPKNKTLAHGRRVNFQQLHNEHLLIIEKLNEIGKKLEFSAKVELAWKKLKQEVQKVDLKVPDKQPKKEETQ